MTMSIRSIRYNPSTAAYEGRVDVIRGGQTFRYPCSVPGPLNMPMTDVRKSMQRSAARMSDSPPELFSRR
ncbi:hypothetical protein SAMN04488515_1508 [Cognatiyoonia koreensis]|uniref:Uncharacterized protein n=1 Tax=Cognatiyoonia koreensis TaxID=364200 RepID=A0A1I0PXH3_9RHOB|nr:hypothetical protein SAMN04488515_1508 [Cognatiyoonia koreensis]